MRDNGGGIVEQALMTSSLFLREARRSRASVRATNPPRFFARQVDISR
jgi:C-terminal processing protease CtpA/Prc